MKKPYWLLKKIGEHLKQIKNKNIHQFKCFNLYCQDESRIGLLTMNHKALTIKGVKPLCRYQHKFDNVYLFGAFSPVNGNHLLLEMPHCNTDNFQVFLTELSQIDKDEFKIVVLDNGAFHKAKRLMIPPNIELIFLPPYSPELNPAEKVWWKIKREFKNKFFESMDDLKNHITVATKQLNNQSIQQLTAYQYYTNAFWTTFNV
nr:IS630 family transposase [Hydrotalea sp.]